MTVPSRRTAAASTDPSDPSDPSDVAVRAGRRRLTVDYKTRIVQEAAQCRTPGEIGSLLRREGLFSSHLTMWRKQYHDGARQALARTRGPKPTRANPRDVTRLQRENAALRAATRARGAGDHHPKESGGAPRTRAERRARRQHMTAMLQEHDPTCGVARLSAALGVPRSSAYRWRRPAVRPIANSTTVDTPTVDSTTVARHPSPRALAPEAQAQVLAYLRDPRVVDRAPAQVHAALLDEGTYVCRVRTMYRLLASFHEVRARRAQRVHRPHPVPRLVATRPNHVWTWDVTDLRGPVKGERYKLYVVLDLCSRYVVAWMLAWQESARLAQRLIRTACAREGIVQGQLTTHSDRGSIQVARDLHELYQALGIVRSLSRPRVSNDNPYSESLFKTTTYAPTYPERFDGYAQALDWCTAFFPYYNHEHHHEGLAWLTPATVHHGHAPEILAQRQRVMDGAFQQHPERFVKGPPRVPQLPHEVWINQLVDQTAVIG